ncbi:MAG: pantoate--beta-alanine ligase [Candidatus Dormibacteria bacterium]
MPEPGTPAAASAGPTVTLAASPVDLRILTARWRCSGDRVALVPTMGAIHRGHLALVARARSECDRVVVSIFVNPLQFGPDEDYLRYPRQPQADFELLGEAGVDAVYGPTVEELYPSSFSTSVELDLPGLGRFEGRARPGHFRGVATVVTKLFAATGPCRAYFGEKDAQQALLVTQLARDLDLGVEVEVCPTVRDPDGLAVSSRNRYLSAEHRSSALALSRWIRAAHFQFRDGLASGPSLRALAAESVGRESGVELEYGDVVDPVTFVSLDRVTAESRLMVAARVGGVRLIDTGVLGRDPGF